MDDYLAAGFSYSYPLSRRQAKRDACSILAEEAERCAKDAPVRWPHHQVDRLQAALLELAEELRRRGGRPGEVK